MTKKIPNNIGELAQLILQTADATQKAELSIKYSAFFTAGEITSEILLTPLDRPARPLKPVLLLPKDMPKRRSRKKLSDKVALLHAVAHIELNAIDLAWDIIIRFGAKMPEKFISDWVVVAAEEAKHFLLINERLKDLDSFYGQLPAHDNLWNAAYDTKDDIAARLAIVPMVLEARGLDVTPMMIEKYTKAGDITTASILKIIYAEEVSHVYKGSFWFNYIAKEKNIPPEKYFQQLVRTFFSGKLSPPFNKKARDHAELYEEYYLPLVKD